MPIPGALLFFYVSATNTPQNTYSDVGLTTPNKNPVPADAAGTFPNIFMLGAAYKVVLTDASGNQIWTADPVYGGAGSGSGLRAVTGDTTVLSSDSLLEVDATAGNRTITYPIGLGSPTQTQPVTIVKVDGTANQVLIIDSNGPTLRGALVTAANGANMDSCIVYSNGTALRII